MESQIYDNWVFVTVILQCDTCGVEENISHELRELDEPVFDYGFGFDKSQLIGFVQWDEETDTFRCETCRIPEEDEDDQSLDFRDDSWAV